jgi:hypothetical protein
MGGVITFVPAVPTEPISNADWRDLLNEISTADANTFVRLVVHKETADAPPGKEYDFPASYFSFIPKFVATIPVEDPPIVPPPPNTIVTLWAADMAKNVRDKANGAIVGQLAYLASVDVDMATKTRVATDPAQHDWVKITSTNFKDRWIAADVLSATRP